MSDKDEPVESPSKLAVIAGICACVVGTYGVLMIHMLGWTS